MNSFPPPPRSSASLAVTMFLGGFCAYGIAHLPDNVPWWVSWLMGGVLTGVAGLVHLYQDKPPPKV